MIGNCSALILAGGDSRRMGQDKAGIVLDGQTLLQRMVSIAQPLFAEIIISVRQPRPEIDLPQICDDPANSGPLAGLAAGLQSATKPWVFAVACDMPFIAAPLIEYLAQQRGEFQAVVPMVRGYPQPLAAYYSASCVPAILACLNGSGKHSLRVLLDRLQVRYVAEAEMLQADPQLNGFFDLDTPADVAQARRQLQVGL
ncbi:MAG: molybdenum cofactor guanylyltransferase [Sideroxydans sp.]|jgi:molybdopterin-guanine dinucleotide biosynthesis protein A